MGRYITRYGECPDLDMADVHKSSHVHTLFPRREGMGGTGTLGESGWEVWEVEGREFVPGWLWTVGPHIVL